MLNFTPLSPREGGVEDGVELCPDATYLKLTGKSPEEAFPNLKSTAHA